MFRVKIILLSILISGSVLVGFGLYFLSIINRAGMDRIDQEILALAGSQLHAPPRAPVWQSFGKSLHFIYDEKQLRELIIHVTGPEKEVFFKSANWPEEISEASFQEFDHEMSPFPGLAGQVGGRAFPDSRTSSGPAEGFRFNRDAARNGSGPRMPPRFNEGDEPRRQLLLQPFDGDRNRQIMPPIVDEGRRPPVQIKKACFHTIKTATGTWRTAIIGNQWVTAMIGMNMAGFFQEAERFKSAFLIALPLALLFLAAGGWLIADRAMRPVALITRTAESITAQGLDKRVPKIDSGTELSRLVTVINSMLERLQKSFVQALRFSADAAHELQTPLTVLQGELDDAVQHAPIGSEEQRRYGGLLEEVQRLKAIVQKLLILARTDAGKLKLHLELVDLSGVIESACEDAGVIAPHLRIEKEIAPAAMVKADPDLLRQVIQNLMSNAVKYNVEKGMVRFSLRVRSDTAYVTISNTGNPIPVKDREMIFDRFYRVDKSRSRAVPGAGLGLSLAREIVHAHHGHLRLDPGSDSMVSFTLSLPCLSHDLKSS